MRAARLLGDVAALDRRLAEHGGRLCVRVGDPVAAGRGRGGGPGRGRGPRQRRRHPLRDPPRHGDVAAALDAAGVAWRTSWGTLVHAARAGCSPQAGTLSQVFTPFFRAWARTPWEPWPEPGDAALARRPRRPAPGRAGALPAARRAGRRRRPCPASAGARGPPGPGRRPGRPLRRRARPPRPGRHVGALGRPPLRHALAPHGGRGRRRVHRPAGPRSCASWPGATGTPTCCTPRPSLVERPDEGHLRRPAVARRPRGVRGVEARAAPASRWSTPACASCAPPGGCTTGCGCSPRRSW